MIIGSRGSQLALWQARWVQSQVPGSEIVVIKTTGDKITDVPLSRVGTKALFTKEIEEALLAGRIDVAVHSLKDVPAEIDPRLEIAAIPRREDPRDAVVGRRLKELGVGAVVGTSSLRRAAQIRHLHRNVRVEDLRGNVDTRLRKLDDGRYEAIVLAAAGLRRLGLESRITEVLEPELMCPAIGQGALAIQTRADDARAKGAVAALDDPAARAETTAERTLSLELGGGCQVPIGGSARASGSQLRLIAMVASPHGVEMIRAAADGSMSDPVGLARRVVQDLVARGARDILDQVHAS